MKVASLVERVGLWDSPDLAPGKWDLKLGLYGEWGESGGVAGQLTRQITNAIGVFARGQAGLAKVDRRWEPEASGALGVRWTW